MSDNKLPFVLSLSKDRVCGCCKLTVERDRLRAHRSCFDKLSTNGTGEAAE